MIYSLRYHFSITELFDYKKIKHDVRYASVKVIKSKTFPSGPTEFPHSFSQWKSFPTRFTVLFSNVFNLTYFVISIGNFTSTKYIFFQSLSTASPSKLRSIFYPFYLISQKKKFITTKNYSSLYWNIHSRWCKNVDNIFLAPMD